MSLHSPSFIAFDWKLTHDWLLEHLNRAESKISAAPFPLDRLTVDANGIWGINLPPGAAIDPTKVSNDTSSVHSPDDKDAEAWWSVANDVNRRAAEAAKSYCGVHGHTWKAYQGFREFYDYCTKCDLKKPNE